MHYITGKDRYELQLFSSLEDSIEDDNPVRLIDALVDMIYSCDPSRFSYKGQGQTGRKSYHPCTLLKLYLYGYLNRISSSRRLEAETRRNLELKWLLCDLHPDFKTIADYRKDNADAIRYMTLSFRGFLKEEGFISGKKIAYDGSKVKACCSKEKVLTQRSISSRLVKMKEQLEEYLCSLNSSDHAEDLAEELDHFLDKADINKAMLEEITSLREKIRELEALREQIQSSEHNSYCLTDPQAHLMKSRDGFILAYNVQTGVDSANKMIVLAEATTDVCDANALEENVDKTKEQLGITPDILTADKGYSNISQIKSIESQGKSRCAVPLSQPPAQKRDNRSGVSFCYDPCRDEYTCSQGKKLLRKARRVIQHNTIYTIYKAKKADCLSCPLYGKCTTSKYGRTIKIPESQEFKNQYLKGLQAEEMQELMASRKALIEHVFGTLKRWMGKVPLLLTTKAKVQIEIDLYATAYNLRRLLNIEDVPRLLQRIAACAHSKTTKQAFCCTLLPLAS